jgi:hypothetical protein
MLKKSRIATVLASLAVVSLAAPPAMANHRNWGGWGRHRDRIDTGDVVAGILILGGIAAVASAASNAKKKQRDRDDYRYPDNDYPQQRERSGGYADDDRSERRDTRSGNGTGIDGAIDRCMDEVSRGSTKIDEVDSVNRDGDGWRVQGRTSGGGNFSCSIDGDGRIRNVNIDGRAV